MTSEVRQDISRGINIGDLLLLLSEGNPGALNALCQLGKAFPDNCFILFLHLDDMNLRGSQLYVAFAYHCNRNLEKFEACIVNRDPAMIKTVNDNARQGCCDFWLAVQKGASFPGGRPRLPDDYFTNPKYQEPAQTAS